MAVPTMLSRYAPTPSGYLHRGNLFSMLLTWLWTRQQGGRILLRIDDLDRARFRPQYLEGIFRSLEAWGLDWDLGPSGPEDFERHWSQQQRLPLYQAQFEALQSQNLVFPCQCSRAQQRREQLDGGYGGRCLAQKPPYESERQWRWRPELKEISLLHPDGRWRSGRPASALRHAVLRQKNGQVAYQLSSLVDDLHFGVSHVFRGRDLWHSSLFQAQLAAQLGRGDYQKISFAHHPLVQDAQGRKLSKSQASAPDHPAQFWTWFSDQWGWGPKIDSAQSLLEEAQVRRLFTDNGASFWDHFHIHY